MSYRFTCSAVVLLAGLVLSLPLAAQSPGYAPYENPMGLDSHWWQNDWWEEGVLHPSATHALKTEWIEYANGETTVPTMLVMPADASPEKRYPAVLYQHGRRGLDELVQRQVKRIAARGFVVLAPDVYSARFIEKLPIAHDYATELDVAAAVPVLLARPEISTSKICMASHTRGGYMALKAATTHAAQKDVACYLSWYPHWQDPNAPEPMQVYRYAIEVDQLSMPVLIFIGDQEQYQRRRSIETGVRSLQAAGKDATLIVYPGVGRGFDFRPPHVRSFADDLAAKDAVQRADGFIRKHLAAFAK